MRSTDQGLDRYAPAGALAELRARPEPRSPRFRLGFGRIGSALLALLVALSLVAGSASPSFAADGTPYSSGLTQPAGLIWLPGDLGGHLWVSDHLFGFCRLDPVVGSTTYAVNQTTCFNFGGAGGAAGQAAYDAKDNWIYVPDSSTNGQGIWRLHFHPDTETIHESTVIGATLGLSGNKPNSVALGSDKKLYISFLKTGNIVRLPSPNGVGQVLESVGTSSDGRLVLSLVFVGDDLYMAESGAVSRIAAATGCAGDCQGAVTTFNVAAPLALTTDGTYLYAGELTAVSRYHLGTQATELYSNGGLINGVGTAFAGISGLGVDASGNLYVGNDPTDGVQIRQGSIWFIAAGSPPGGSVVPPAPTTTTLYDGTDVNTPGGVIWLPGALGGHLWVSDHLQGFCRLDQVLGTTGFAINPATCFDFNGAGGAVGQVAFDAKKNLVYIPDSSAQSQGIWRLNYSRATETVGNAVVLIPQRTLGLRKPAAVALGPSGGALFVSFLKGGNIFRINTPAAATQTGRIVAKSSNGLRVVSLALVGTDLYLAETVAVTKIANIAQCGGLCTAAATPVNVAAPLALAYRAGALFIADISSVTRHTMLTGAQEIWATGGVGANGVNAPFQNISALGVDPVGNLYVGDDPSDGALLFTGRVWKVTPLAP